MVVMNIVMQISPEFSAAAGQPLSQQPSRKVLDTG